jgi:hypothetical protein
VSQCVLLTCYRFLVTVFRFFVPVSQLACERHDVLFGLAAHSFITAGQRDQAAEPGLGDHARRARLHRYDDARAIRGYLPAELDWVATRGIRVITPAAKLLALPVVGPALRWAEHRLADLPGARDVGGFLVACCRRV